MNDRRKGPRGPHGVEGDDGGDDLQLPDPEVPWWFWFTPGPDTSWWDVVMLVLMYASPFLIKWLVG